MIDGLAWAASSGMGGEGYMSSGLQRVVGDMNETRSQERATRR